MAEFWSVYAFPTVIIVAQIVAILVPLLTAVAYLTYAERKVIAAMQLRKGPNVVGPFGLLQPLADGLKLLFKETIIPSGANRVVFMAAPMITFVLAVVAWAVIPFDKGVVLADINVGILYLFAISSLGVYGIIMAGWASNSVYPSLARCALRRKWCPMRCRSGLSLSRFCSVSGRLISRMLSRRSGPFGSVFRCCPCL